MNNLTISEFDFSFPNELIALYPQKNRDSAKMMVIDKKRLTIHHKSISDLSDYFDENDVIVRNDTKVFPARIFGAKDKTFGKVEVLLIKHIESDNNSSKWHCMINMNKKVREATKINISNSFYGIITNTHISYTSTTPLHEIVFPTSYDKLLSLINQIGSIPLPPYIKRETKASDYEDYQTVYAKKIGAIAAPTAGLHFTKNLINKIMQKNARIIDITLHVGPGTFTPVQSEDITKHKIHSEEYCVSDENFSLIKKQISLNKPLTAIGTTSVRTIETLLSTNEIEGSSSLYIYPGYKFKGVTKLLTNFHLPKSTLFMLVSAFIGDTSFTKKCYFEAFENKYRLFSYGDAMLII